MARVRILTARIADEVRGTVKALAAADGITKLERRMAPRMKRDLDDHMREVVKRTLRDTRVRSRTGRMAKSLHKGIKVYGTRLDTLRTEIWAPEYVHALEYGATIRPRNAKVLTIPMPAALRPDGTPKLKSPRSWKMYGTFSYTSRKTGQSYLAYKRSDGKLVLLYVYVDMARIKPQLGLRKTYNAMLRQLYTRWGNIMAEEMARTDLTKIVDDGARGKGKMGIARRLLKFKR